ncbi:OST-HTH/LOTUS domain-containing protein [Pseudoxanthomonas sp. LjRoot127]
MIETLSIAAHNVATQREVQRQLGCCLIRLQQYEHAVKELVALHDIALGSGQIEGSLDSRRDMVANKTLGQVVGSLFDNHIVPEGFEDASSDDELVSLGGIAVRMKFRLQLSRTDYETAKKDIADLVHLRNRLVHQFIQQFDLWTAAGCEAALADLEVSSRRIETCISQLQIWREWLDQSLQNAAAFVRSDEFQNAIVLGILPDGTVAWPIAAVAEKLRDAWRSVSVDGWAVVSEAGEWVTARYPDLTAERHGCSSWRQVLHESRQFDLRYFQIGDRRLACYRPRAESDHK